MQQDVTAFLLGALSRSPSKLERIVRAVSLESGLLGQLVLSAIMCGSFAPVSPNSLQYISRTEVSPSKASLYAS